MFHLAILISSLYSSSRRITSLNNSRYKSGTWNPGLGSVSRGDKPEQFETDAYVYLDYKKKQHRLLPETEYVWTERGYEKFLKNTKLDESKWRTPSGKLVHQVINGMHVLRGDVYSLKT